MARLTEDERGRRQREYAGRYMPSTRFRLKRQGLCGACRGVIREGDEGVYRYYEGLGAGELVHVEHVDLVPATVAS